MARFVRRRFRRIKVTTEARRGSVLTGRRAKIFLRKPGIPSAKLKG